MKSGDLDKRLSAYQDGALADTRRDRFERELERDPALQEQLSRSRALSQLVRESWTDGPASPPPELLIAALRPQLAAITRERRARPVWQQALDDWRIRLSHWLGPMPLATSGVAAFLLALALLPRPESPLPNLSALLPSGQVEFPSAPLAPAQRQSSPFTRPSSSFSPATLSPDAAAGVYDFAPGESPAMIFQGEDGSTILWLLEQDDLSFLFERTDRWG